MKTNPPHLETGPLTIQEFERLPDDGWQLELVRGQVVREPPAGHEHSRIGVRIASLLDVFARERGLGTVTGADGGYLLFDEPPTVRAPDAAFVQRGRLAPEIKGFPPLAPDLAVEVISPSNTMSEIQAKVLEYLDAGSRLVWVVDPDPRTVTVYHSRDEIRLIMGDGEIDGADVLPGLRLKVSELFER